MPDKLSQLREKMREKDVDYYFVPTRDDHNNEYVPACWQRRVWLTNFTGSYGEALVGHEKAYLWTDPRYYLQASQELNAKQFTLMKQIQGVAAPISTWLAENAHNAVVGVDPKVLSIAQHKQWEKSLASVHGELTAMSENLIDTLWKDRPSLPEKPLQILDEKYTGLSVEKKLTHVRDAMTEVGAQSLVISQLDEIMWLFNIRGNDIPFNPLVISYAIITLDDAFLFLHLHVVAQDALSYFAKHTIELKSYDTFQQNLRSLKGTVMVDPATVSWWVALQCSDAILIEHTSPIAMMKAIKNKTELNGIREAHRIDAIALVKFFHWLEINWKKGVTEVTAADQLEIFRREDKRCKDLSFPTICGFADHGAIIHFQATKATAYAITDQNMLLIDSGAQYCEGTTDTTRTIHLGNPTAQQKKHYTLVLKGHLALRHTPFPKGVCGEHVNTIARMPLWENHLDYGHGTGHGVGCYLCVHEGPQRISYGASNIALVPGMVVSNEPGVYFENQYGIRIENVCEIVEDDAGFLTMADFTMVPYARNLIDCALLTTREIKQVNAYHEAVYTLLSKELPSDARDWLCTATLPLK